MRDENNKVENNLRGGGVVMQLMILFTDIYKDVAVFLMIINAY